MRMKKKKSCFVEKIIKRNLREGWNKQIGVTWLKACIMYVKGCCELCMMFRYILIK